MTILRKGRVAVSNLGVEGHRSADTTPEPALVVIVVIS